MTANIRGGYSMKPHVQAFANALEAELGTTLSFGTYAGHSPPEGPTQAIDVFNTDDNAGYAQQDRICAFAKANAKRFGIRYCIRRHHIWNIERDAEGWRDQGVTGDRTADHYNHTHLTFYATATGPFVVPTSPTPERKMNVLFVYDFNEETGVWITDGLFRRPTNDASPYLNNGAKHLGKFTAGQHNELTDVRRLA